MQRTVPHELSIRSFVRVLYIYGPSPPKSSTTPRLQFGNDSDPKALSGLTDYPAFASDPRGPSHGFAESFLVRGHLNGPDSGAIAPIFGYDV